jgi:DNA mismatch repair protein MutL
MSIRILPDEIASQIAAGEVIERPASVIKELVENALDSGATRIEIRVHGSGQPLIEISDNGSGISESELPLAVARHATSKLVTADDLFSIRTLGFRGEALASIASVSHLTLSSGIQDQTTGALLRVDGGHITDRKPLPGFHGTTIRVEDLFYNVPARLKFLKRDTTEKQNNDAYISRYALAYPGVQFKVWQDDSVTLQTSGSGERREALGAIYGIEYARQMMEVTYSDHDIQVEGYTSPLALTRSNRREMTFFVNGRWIQDTSLSAALLQAYHTYLMVGRYPVSALFIQMPPEEVDVNVHPAKAEVRFRAADQVFSVIQRAVRKALLVSNPIPEVAPPGSWQAAIPVQQTFTPARFLDTIEPSPQAQLPDIQQADSSTSSVVDDVPPIPVRPAGVMPLLRLVGQVGGTYLVAEGPDGLYLIDQHAAHERVLYERYIQQRGKPMMAQALLEPTAVHFPKGQADLLDDQLEVINRMGFTVESFGAGSFLVRSVPAIFSNLPPAAALRVLVEDFEEDETPFQTEIEAKLVARICKRAAVKGGQNLSVEEQRQLLDDLEQCTSPRTCPHGRPTMIHLSVDLLERQFGRRGAR